MRKTVLLLLIIIILCSCPAENTDFVNLFLNKDRDAPTMLDYELRENRICFITFDENVTITDAHLNGENVFRPSKETRMVQLDFSSEIKPGEEKTLFLTAEDKAGNTSRYAIRLTGVNLRQADLLITEVSMKGTATSPDRIELTATEGGSVLGYAVLDGIIGHENHRYYLPEIHLNRNDIIVIYWDRCESLPATLIRDTERTYYLYAESKETLIGTNGAVILYNHTNGKGEIEDSLLYNTSDASNNNGYGNTTSEESAKHLKNIEQWFGNTFRSDQVTSSRVVARYYPYEDTNTASDFHVTAARNSTFGYPNTNVIYEP